MLIGLFLMIVASLDASYYVSSLEVFSPSGVSSVSSARSSAGCMGLLKASTSGALHLRYGLLVVVLCFSLYQLYPSLSRNLTTALPFFLLYLMLLQKVRNLYPHLF